MNFTSTIKEDGSFASCFKMVERSLQVTSITSDITEKKNNSVLKFSSYTKPVQANQHMNMITDCC